VYQAQFQGESEYGPNANGKPKSDATLPDSSSNASLPSQPTSDTTAAEADGQREVSKTDPKGKREPPLHNHVFQTIFLDRDSSEHKWTRNDIAKDKIILEKWWHQQVSFLYLGCIIVLLTLVLTPPRVLRHPVAFYRTLYVI
jgi:hypothetical protein